MGAAQQRLIDSLYLETTSAGQTSQIAGDFNRQVSIMPLTADMKAELLSRFEEENLGPDNIEINEEPSGKTNPAVYSAFLHNPHQGQNSFLDTTYIDPPPQNKSEIEAIADQVVSERHEKGHRHQWKNNAVTAATYYNSASPLVLTARDSIRLELLTEAGTMAYTGFQGYLDDRDSIKAATRKSPVTPEDFEKALATSRGDIDQALSIVALESLKRNSNNYLSVTDYRPQKESMSLHDWYCSQALLKRRLSNQSVYDIGVYDAAPPIFVRLDDDDVLQLGQRLGFSAFGKGKPDAAFTQDPVLAPRFERQVQASNILEGIYSEQDVPTLSEALDYYFGMTKAQYLEFSKNFKGGDAPMQMIRPLITQVVPITSGREFRDVVEYTH